MADDRDDPIRTALDRAWHRAAPTDDDLAAMDAQFRSMLAASASTRRAAANARRTRVLLAVGLAAAAGVALVIRRAVLDRQAPAMAHHTAPRETAPAAPAWAAQVVSPGGRMDARDDDGGRVALVHEGTVEFSGHHRIDQGYRVRIPSLDVDLEPLGTRFVVEVTATRARVTVREGVVQATCHRGARPSYAVLGAGDVAEFPARCDDTGDAALALYRMAQRFEGDARAASRVSLVAAVEALVARHPTHPSAPHARWMLGRARCAMGDVGEGTRALREAQQRDAHLVGDVEAVCRAAAGRAHDAGR